MLDEAKFWIMLMSPKANARHSPISSSTAIAIFMGSDFKIRAFLGL
jgi:hypothetical protein